MLTTADPKHAIRAVPLLQQAVNGRGPAYACGRGLNLAALASPRAYDRLRILDTVLQPHGTNPAVGEYAARSRRHWPADTS